ncbi:MAG TPA: DinB family protein [Thermomicrobiales bacterium]|nr:DinB family protein [Thermomicrobiales bacterium]
MPAHLTASQDVLEELYAALLDLLRGLDDAALAWRPPLPETNSIAALVHHTVGATESWLARALDESLARDRDAEFRASATAAEAVALVERSRERVRAQFARLAAVEPGTVRQLQRHGHAAAQPLTVAWCVEHALIHAGEHWGQIQLTRQLHAARG